MPRRGSPLVWVAVSALVGLAFAGVLYRVITASADEALKSAPKLVGGSGDTDERERALTDATVQLVADLAAGRSDAAYARMSGTYRALVSPERFRAAVAANPLLRGAHDVTPTHWTMQGGTADVRGSVADASGRRTAFVSGFAREDSSWKATSFSIGNVPALPQGPP
jgi:hypothetical protein